MDLSAQVKKIYLLELDQAACVVMLVSWREMVDELPYPGAHAHWKHHIAHYKSNKEECVV